MNLPLITVYGTILLQDGSPGEGYVSFRLTGQLQDTESGVIYPPILQRANLDEEGKFRVETVASMGEAANPQGLGYNVHISVKGYTDPKRYVIILHESLAPEVDLATLPPAVSSEEYIYPGGVPGPAGPQGPQGESTIRFHGEGPPGVILGARPHDEYVDNLTGNLYSNL